MLDDILSQVKKPARYLGNEWNVTRKDFDRTKVKFVLCFPDIYEVGMSNLGVRILYEVINSMEGVLCERVFHPAPDMEGLLHKRNKRIFSLESKREISAFDIIGFSLGYELTYTNVLNILDLAGIPLHSTSRLKGWPLVIAGGSCMLNPQPLADFIDLFVIGEAEEAIVEIIQVYKEAKQETGNRKQDLLYRLSGIEGVYVPLLFKKGQRIKKRIIKDLDKVIYPLNWLVPNIGVIHDRLSLEISRGCPHNCRFCQARSLYFPYRQRSGRRILDLSNSLYKNSGYGQVSLLGLSAGDHSEIEEILRSLICNFEREAVGIALPSLKINPVTKSSPKSLSRLLGLLARIKKNGLTFAPETATNRLARLINKNFDMGQLFKVSEEAYRLGYRHLKLYFMIGLPSESHGDLDAIIELCHQLSELKRKVSKGPAQINASISTLIPKPHTPLQWMAMESLTRIEEKQNYLKSKLKGKHRRLKVSFHNRYMSYIEAVLSRGDRNLGRVLLFAWRRGLRLQAWGEYFSFDGWCQAFKKSDIEPDFYLRRYAKTEEFCWDFIDTGISKERLLLEFEKTQLQMNTR
jgi:radical SAM family uncharacterized protein